MIRQFLADETGLELSEYAIAAALVVAAVATALTLLSNSITDRIGALANSISG